MTISGVPTTRPTVTDQALFPVVAGRWATAVHDLRDHRALPELGAACWWALVATIAVFVDQLGRRGFWLVGLLAVAAFGGLAVGGWIS